MTPHPDTVVLARLVKQMRDKQRLYFRTKDRTVLDESISLERAVDEMVTSILQGPDLFSNEPDAVVVP